jgi:hypothetical protein
VNDGNRIVLCDSDAKGAFKVYRAPDAAEVERLRSEVQRLTVDLHGFIDKAANARANAIREAVSKIDGLRCLEGTWLSKGSAIMALQSLLDKKEGEDAESSS